MSTSKVKLIRLQPDTVILPFDCGDTDLNGFLFDDAKNYSKDLIAVTYIIQNEEKTLAYFNYLNDKISHTDLDGNLAKFIERIGVMLPKEKGEHKSYPAVKIGRLAVDLEYQKGGGYGKMIINYTKGNFTKNNKTGCKFITVDAYRKSLQFYEKMGFKYLSGKDKKSDTRLMYYNLEAITD
ncbi:GNAT family N-acetyltransferase [Flavobacterium acetivorans]|uniref:GNAT family N-acetyltransferase n=1 Tax=Flavobacterium acetivorans TaxID=2893883 RepID=UPI001E385399|nr:GNAT family N-acetyltransferase [Flavobacterium sp. F-29]UFH34434.1 GNAT family N-acetyltransferase [Flavobacterium sp. F-29]